MSEARFNPDIHTPEAFTDQVGEIAASYPDAIFVGSVGRAALLGVDLAPYKRRISPEARDIDITFTDTGAPDDIQEHAYPFPVDYAFYDQIIIPEGDERATIYYDPRRPDVCAELPAEVFHTYPARYSGVNINTFHPDTMMRLQEINGSRRLKDRRNLREFEQLLWRGWRSRIPDHYFEPLREMQSEIKEHPDLRLQQRVERAQQIYVHITPLAARELLTPTLKTLKHGLGLQSRESKDKTTHKQKRV